MRIERAIDAFLDWRRLERDATPRSTDSYRRILWKLAEDYPEAELRSLTTTDLRTFLKRWENRSSSTRSNVISVLHSFFEWANVEDEIDVDPSAKIRRPKKRRPDVYRPSLDELERVRAAALPHERPAIVLMEGAGLRRSEVIACRWADFDMVRGRLRVFRKGQHWFYLPLASGRRRRAPHESSVSSSPSSTTTSSRSRSNSSSRSTNACAGGRIRRSRRATRRSGAWCTASASALASASSRRTSCATASPIASSARAAAMSPRCRPLLGPLAYRHDAALHRRDRGRRARPGACACAAARDAQASPDLTTLETDVAAALQSAGVEAAGIEPASADVTDRASTSLGRDLSFARTAGSRPTYRRASHP